MKKLNFCTLFNYDYLHYGLCLYRSLEENCADFHIYIFAFDKKCEEFLINAKYSGGLKNATIISLESFEDDRLKKVKKERKISEYCWTCTAPTIYYVLKNYDVESCTYLDSDIFFFSDPKKIIDEIGDKSIMITPHNYIRKHDQSAISGKYCVQFMYFKNDKDGLEALKWWIEKCLDWCYDYPEDGKFGDQKYLDDWPERFSSIHVLRNEGGGLAPWNIEKYKIEEDRIISEESGKEYNIIFYHFHGFKIVNENHAIITDKRYQINDKAINFIYKKYISAMNQAILQIPNFKKRHTRNIRVIHRLILKFFHRYKNKISLK